MKVENARQALAGNHFRNIWRFFDIFPHFPFTQVKQCVIITYKVHIHELSLELLKDLRFRNIGN